MEILDRPQRLISFQHPDVPNSMQLKQSGRVFANVFKTSSCKPIAWETRIHVPRGRRQQQTAYRIPSTSMALSLAFTV